MTTPSQPSAKTILSDKQIAKIVQYWQHREHLESEISDYISNYHTDADYSHDDWGFKKTAYGYQRANIQHEYHIDELKDRISKLDAAYEKWLHDKVGLLLNDRDQDEFTYNLLNNGTKIDV